jgi:hypothetical protein
MKEAKPQISGYVRAETLIPILAVQMLSIPGQPTRRTLALMTEDGNLALGVSAFKFRKGNAPGWMIRAHVLFER